MFVVGSAFVAQGVGFGAEEDEAEALVEREGGALGSGDAEENLFERRVFPSQTQGLFEERGTDAAAAVSGLDVEAAEVGFVGEFGAEFAEKAQAADEVVAIEGTEDEGLGIEVAKPFFGIVDGGGAVGLDGLAEGGRFVAQGLETKVPVGVGISGSEGTKRHITNIAWKGRGSAKNGVRERRDARH